MLEYPSYTAPEDDTWDDAAELRATKDRDFMARGEPTRKLRPNAWGWLFLLSFVLWAGLGAAYVFDAPQALGVENQK